MGGGGSDRPRRVGEEGGQLQAEGDGGEKGSEGVKRAKGSDGADVMSGQRASERARSKLSGSGARGVDPGLAVAGGGGGGGGGGVGGGWTESGVVMHRGHGRTEQTGELTATGQDKLSLLGLSRHPGISISRSQPSIPISSSPPTTPPFQNPLAWSIPSQPVSASRSPTSRFSRRILRANSGAVNNPLDQINHHHHHHHHHLHRLAPPLLQGQSQARRPHIPVTHPPQTQSA
ncbi:hypothetical protein CISG_09577 [Coccidioides immitis RMSCC 3703]|uniref:Uncharacterized protein n=1 Tax=Coccidioides immitis RMSCC 3703 TaxID=454286 RepID=A0A0J8RBE3_COCIT|nr:hypothetical protein CISG_09577 [Coccidioides immitis RMSCC 3703]